jgi:hypothetical protein
VFQQRLESSDLDGFHSLGTARSALESASVKAATDCVAPAALNNPEITTLYQENRLKEVTNWIVLRSNACDNPLTAMRLLHDRIYGQGTGQTFLRGDYLDDLPRAVGERIKVEVLRRIVQNSNEIRGSNAMVPREAAQEATFAWSMLRQMMCSISVNIRPIDRGSSISFLQMDKASSTSMRAKEAGFSSGTTRR